MTRENYFDEPIATRYDETSAEMFEPEALDPVLDLLVELAGDGRALELGIGTGRVALPLSQRGVPVHGIDLSEEMVAKLREKPGGDEIPVTIGDFSTTKVDGTFRVAYLVYNTILNLTSQDAQVACFQNVGEHLEPGGCFVIEVIVPQLQRLSGGETVIPFAFTDDYWGFDEYEVVNQGLRSHHFERVGDEIRYVTLPFRYAWPAELDLMALLGGMRLRDRWGGWQREPFTAESRKHVSIWQKGS